jgi:serine/threonine-protein kinase
MIFGTPEYMSPEQAEGKDSDHRVDVYAVGCVMYHVLTGETPFQSDSFMGMLTKHLLEDPVPPSVRRPDLAIPTALDAIVLKALEKDRDARWQSMQELIDAIEASPGEAETVSRGSATRELPKATARPASSRVRAIAPNVVTEKVAVAPAAPRPRPSRKLAFVAAGVAVGTAGALWWVLSRPAAPVAPPPVAGPPAPAPRIPAPAPPPAPIAAPAPEAQPPSLPPKPEGHEPRRGGKPRRGLTSAPPSDEPPAAVPPPAAPAKTPKPTVPTPPELKPFPQ